MVSISVLIPTYNVEKYIRECLDSVINQTFEDIEIIIIDDESTDNTLNILKEYAAKDSRIKLYQNDGKRWVAYTRNRLISLAKGKYVYFLDSDDYIELHALERLYEVAEEKSLDILMFKARTFEDRTKREIEDVYVEMYYLERIAEDKVFTFDDIKVFAMEMCVNLPAKLFRRDLVQNIEFPNGYIFEDNPFFLEALLKAKNMYFLREYLYNKRERRKSIMTTRDETYMDIIDIGEFVKDAVKRQGKYEELKPYVYQFIIRVYQYMMRRVSLRTRFKYFKEMKKKHIGNKDEYEEVRNEIYYKYQSMFESCINSNNYLEYELRLYYRLIKHLRTTLKEWEMEKSMWLKNRTIPKRFRIKTDNLT